jgi:hypothetical protein
LAQMTGLSAGLNWYSYGNLSYAPTTSPGVGALSVCVTNRKGLIA